MVSYAGGWDAPFGITLVIDLLSAIMLLLTAVVGVSTTIYAAGTIDLKKTHENFYIFFHGMIMGVNGAFITGDIFNLYVWFEVLLMASFAMLVLGNSRQQLEGGLTYLIANLFSSILFLSAIGLLYNHTGTLNLADLSIKLNHEGPDMIKKTSMGLFFLAFAIKAALFPFFFWLPSSYPTPPPAIMAIFAGLLTKVGIYAMLRLYTLFFFTGQAFWNTLLMSIAGITMVIGAVAATTQNDIRKVLSFSIISQMGYLIRGLAFFSPLAHAATIYFMAHNILVKTNLFFIAGIIGETEGSYDLKKIGGWLNRYPLIATLFFISATALSGIPPLSGFTGKYLMARSGFMDGNYIPAMLIIGVSFITLIYLMRIWNNIFWKPQTKDHKPKRIKLSMIGPVIILTLVILVLGLGAGYFFEMASMAAEQIFHPVEYLETVLNHK